MSRAAHLLHLAKRFATSLLPVGPSAADAAWADGLLGPGERAIWASLSPQDRRHAAGVARRVEADLGPAATRPVLAAALLHDCGKAASGLGTFRRSVATVAAAALGRDRAVAWQDRGGPLGRIGAYLDHPRIGAELLAGAGADPLTVAWAAEHHLPERAWTLDRRIGRALKAADDD